MKAFLITCLLLSLLGLVCRFCFLAWSEYPRVVKYSRGEDVFLTIVALCWIGWAGSLLFL